MKPVGGVVHLVIIYPIRLSLLQYFRCDERDISVSLNEIDGSD